MMKKNFIINDFTLILVPEEAREIEEEEEVVADEVARADNPTL